VRPLRSRDDRIAQLHGELNEALSVTRRVVLGALPVARALDVSNPELVSALTMRESCALREELLEVSSECQRLHQAPTIARERQRDGAGGSGLGGGLARRRIARRSRTCLARSVDERCNVDDAASRTGQAESMGYDSMTTRAAELGALLAVIAARRAPVLVALDGRSGTGKTTLARAIASSFDATIVASDDFFAGGTGGDWASRTPAQRASACIDWRRLRTQALEPLLAGRSACWHLFDFVAGIRTATNAVECPAAPIILLDGAYSARPELSDLIGLSVLLELPDAIRRARLVNREGAAFMTGWHATWDAAEDYYFTHLRPPQAFDIVIGQRTRDLRRDRPIQPPAHSRANDEERSQPCAFQASRPHSFGLANRARSETFGR
jgi:uridine kinase